MSAGNIKACVTGVAESLAKEQCAGNSGVGQASRHNAKADKDVEVCEAAGNRITWKLRLDAALWNGLERLSGDARMPHRFRLDLIVNTRCSNRLLKSRPSGGSALPPLWCRQADNFSAFKLVQPTH